jgi:Tfp pilus assembly protein PilN
MINLIPKEDKKRMTVAFYYRLLALFLLMFSFAIFIGSVALLPAYFSSATKDSIAELKLNIQKNDTVPTVGQESLATIEDMNNKLSLVEKAEKNKFPISQNVISDILESKTTDIKITQILYADASTTQGREITILGIAPSRESLLSFEQALENNPAFKNVNLPISSFIKDSNLQFNLTLSPA